MSSNFVYILLMLTYISTLTNCTECLNNSSKCDAELLSNSNIQSLNSKFIELSKISAIDYKHDQSIYQKAHDILSFIFDVLVDPSQILGEVILTLGKTGWGKSTTINLLEGIGFRIDQFQRLIPVNQKQLKTKIGTGLGSTTLFPVYVQTKFGKVYDLPGDEQTRGMITQIINSISKMNMGKSLNKVKLLIVIPASVFSAQGSYGSQFKKYMESSNKLLGGLNKYKQNIMMIVTFANRKNVEYQNIIKSIKSCLNHPDKTLQQYKQLIEHLIGHNRIKIIAQPNYDQEIYSTPKHQKWNDHKFDKIVQEIKRLPSRQCKPSDFSVPYNLKIVQKLTPIMKILVQKVRSQFQTRFNHIQFSGIQLTFVKNFLKQIRSNKHQKLQNFAAKYTTNSYINSTQISKVLRQIQFIYQFLNSYQNKQVELKKDWISSQLQKKLTETLEQIERMCQIKTLNFIKQAQMNRITLKPNSIKFDQIMRKIKRIEKLQNQQHTTIQNKQNQNSSLYDDVVVQVYDKTINQTYQIDQVYLQNVTEQKLYKVPKEIEFMGPVPKERVAYRTQNQNYIEKVPKTRQVPRQSVITTTRQGGRMFFDLFGPRQTFTDTTTTKTIVDQVYFVDEPRTRQIQVPYTEHYQEIQKLSRIEEVEQWRQQQVPVERTRKKQMLRQKQLFRDEIQRILNTTKFTQIMQLLSQQAQKERISLIQSINNAQSIDLRYDTQLTLQNCKNDFQRQHIDLFKSWHNLQHRGLAYHYPQRKINKNGQVMVAD